MSYYLVVLNNTSLHEAQTNYTMFYILTFLTLVHFSKQNNYFRCCYILSQYSDGHKK